MRPGDLIQTADDPTERREPQLYVGEVLNDALTSADEVWVSIPDFDEGHHRFGPVRWDPVVTAKGVFYPKNGAECLVAKPDQKQEVWMPLWVESGEPDDKIEAEAEAPVKSVFGREGAVAAQAGDYAVGQVTGAASEALVAAELKAREEADAAEKKAREEADATEKAARELADNGKQPLDADLTAIAALATTAFGRSLLTPANAAEARALIEAASKAEAEGKQPLDADLTAIAALATEAFGRSLLTAANAAAGRTLLEAQPLDADLTAIAALATTAFGRSLLTAASAAATRELIEAQPLDADLTAIAALATTEFGRSVLTRANAAALRTLAEVGRDRGLVSALPAEPAVGDRCYYWADKTNGIIWLLVYDGEGECKWKRIGGPPLAARSNVSRKSANEAYTSLPTDPLSIVAPLKGDYDITIEAELYNLVSGRQPLLSYAVGATPANSEWRIQTYSASTAISASSGSATYRHAGVAASAKIEEKAASIGGECQYGLRRLRILPVRVI